MKTIVMILALFTALFGLSGCTSSLAAKFAEFEKLGIAEAQVTGKFSSTTYTVTKEHGEREAVFDHSNAWLPKVRFVRRTPLPTPESSPPAAKEEPPSEAKSEPQKQ